MEGDSEALVPDVPSSAIQLLYYKKLEWICSKRREYNAILIELMTRKNEIFSSKISELQKENSDLKKDLEIRVRHYTHWNCSITVEPLPSALTRVSRAGGQKCPARKGQRIGTQLYL